MESCTDNFIARNIWLVNLILFNLWNTSTMENAYHLFTVDESRAKLCAILGDCMEASG